jgi:hypothetical protein
MNLFIGLLNLAIENYDKYEEYLLKKAKVVFFFNKYIKFIKFSLILICII